MSARRALSAAAVLLALAVAPAHGQSFPSKPVRIIVPYAPGGSVDLIARMMSQGMSEPLGQPVVVENRPGAGGAVGVDAVLSKLPYEPEDLAPVSMLASLPIVVAVNEALPVRSIAELIAYAKAHPGAISYSSNGLGSISYLAGELFKRTTAIEIVHVSYRGAAPGGAAVAAGEVQLGFIDSSGVMPHVRAGRARALAITDERRSAIVPELPTVAEAGVSGFAAGSWIGLFAPAKTPPAIIARLNAEAMRVLRLPEVRERMLNVEMEPAPGTVDVMARSVQSDLDKWRAIIRAAGIKGE
jgi:tripartite-type tricarboxylate transporter receptor subunit TctC